MINDRMPVSVPTSRSKTFSLAFIVVLLNAFGNFSLALGMRRIPAAMSLNPFGYIRAMSNPYVALGIVLLILWLLTRMALLSWADLSFVLPITGVGYVLAAVLGHYFLSESVSPASRLGIFLIFFGTAFVGSTKAKTSQTCRGGA